MKLTGQVYAPATRLESSLLNLIPEKLFLVRSYIIAAIAVANGVVARPMSVLS